MLLLLYALLYLFHFTAAQSTHNVTVGVEGSFFSPRTVSAAQGDKINFIFGGDIHSVTQSTFDAPCTPLRGGFSSNFEGRGMDNRGPTVIFTLTVTNVSEPIWYFCAATLPVSHCNNGMVGAINPQSQEMFNQFAEVAHGVTTTPVFTPTLVLAGQGATAALPTTLNDAGLNTLTPSVIISSTTPIPINTTSGSSTISTSAPSNSSSKRGAVIGGAVGASIGVFILLCITLFLYRRLKKQRPESTISSFFAYNPRPPGGQDRFLQATDGGGMVSTINHGSTFSPSSFTTTFDANKEADHTMQSQPPPPLGVSSTSRLTSPMTSEFPSNSTSPLQPVRHLPPIHGVGQLSSHVIAHSDHTDIGAASQGQGGAMYNNGFQNPSIINRQASLRAVVAESHAASQLRQAESSSNTGSEGTVDLQTLAKEVAAVLKKEKMGPGGRSFGNEGTEGRQNEHDPRSTTVTTSPPPRYYTTNNTVEG